MAEAHTGDSTAKAIVKFYETYEEAERLKRDIGPLEFVRTQELIRRFLPSPPDL